MLKDFDKITSEEIKNVTIEYNLHSHNFLCNHATGTVEEYAEQAVVNNLQLLGITDHVASCYWGNSAYGINTYGINVNNIDDLYLTQFDSAFKKYSNQLVLLKGAELEFFNESYEVYKILKDKLDYLILGQHFINVNDLIIWVSSLADNEELTIKFLETELAAVESGFFSILAHPDMIFSWYSGKRDRINKLVEQLVLKAVSNGMLIEFNANGIRNNRFGYPTDFLVDVCKNNNIPVIVSSDCHSPNVIVDSYVKKLQFYLIEKGITVLSLSEIKKRFKNLF